MQASVVIPVWNGASDIEGCLESVFRYSGDGLLEVICVDNGSEDSSADRISTSFPQARVLRQAMNLGFAGGVNVGVEAARGDLLVLLNQDCLVRPGWLTSLAEAFLGWPELGIAGVTVLNQDGSINHAGAQIIKPSGRSDHHTEVRSTDAYSVDYVTGAAFAFRRAVWETVGRFDEGYYPAYYEEADYGYRARRKGFDVAYVPTSQVTHLFSSTEGLRRPFRRAAIQHKMRYRFVCKHFDHAELRAFFAAERQSLIEGDYLNEVFGRLMAARGTLEGLNDILTRRCLDLGEAPDAELHQLLRQGFARLTRQALEATSHLTQPHFEEWTEFRDRIHDLQQREYDLLRRIYFRAPTEMGPEPLLKRLVRLLVLRPLSFLIGRDYLLLAELNTCHVSRLDACQAMILSESDLSDHMLRLFDLSMHYEDL